MNLWGLFCCNLCHQNSSLFFIITVAFSPVFGLIVRQFGRNLLFVLAASFVIIGCHFVLAFTFITPTIVMVGMGLSSAVLNAALFSVLPNLVNKNQIGSAFGFLHSMINLGMALGTIIAGYLADNYGFFTVEIFFYYLSIGEWQFNSIETQKTLLFLHF